MSAQKTLSILFTLFLFAGLLAGCETESTIHGPDELQIYGDWDPSLSKASVSTEDGVTRYDGVHGGTNLYSFFVPDAWNGDLVLYAHGFIDVAMPVDRPTNDRIDEIRDLLLEDGFAFAYSSYRENGFAVQSGGWATKSLATLFRSTVKADPEQTWLVGHSLGGLITLEMAEKEPGDYDGILSIAGPIGGTDMQLDYVANVRLLFDFFYPGVLPGDVLNVPGDLTPAGIQALVVPAVLADPTGVFLISQIDQTPLPAPTNEALIGSLIYALTWNIRGIDDVLARTHGETPIDNMDTIYTSSSGMVPQQALDAINAFIPRYDRTDGADAEMRRNYEPTGRLGIPMIALHNLFDPAVPYMHATDYEAKVEATGNGHLFELRTEYAFEHSNFDPATVLSAFQDLITKANGAPPLARF